MFNKQNNNDYVDKGVNFFVSFTDLAMLLLVTFFIILFFQQIKYKYSEKQFNDKLEKGQETFKIRENIAKILSNNFKGFNNVLVNEKTGVVTILNNEIEFIPNEYILTNQYKTEEFLNRFVPIYINSLKQEEKNYKYVNNIIIEGHTAKPDNNQLDHMKLSLNRAYVIYSYVYNNQYNFNLDNNDIKKIEAVGRGSQNLFNPNNLLDKTNRRVEFHFILDEAKILTDYNNNLKNGVENDKSK